MSVSLYAEVTPALTISSNVGWLLDFLVEYKSYSIGFNSISLNFLQTQKPFQTNPICFYNHF